MTEPQRDYRPLTAAERKQLYTALSRAFDRQMLEVLFHTELDENLDMLVDQSVGLSQVVLDVIQWAERQGRVVELARAAKEQAPGNPLILQACTVLEARVTDEVPTRPPADEPGGADHKPQALGPAATLGMPLIMPNVMALHPHGLPAGLGMSVSVPGTLQHARGLVFQLVVRFSFLTGQMLVAAPQEMAFRDVTGGCAVGTMPAPAPSDTVELSAFVMAIPYYALNLTPTNGMTIYPLTAVASLYVNNGVVAQSPATPFSVRW